MNFQPNTLLHHSRVAPGSVLDRSVCVMCPERPRVGTCFGGEAFADGFGDFFAGFRCGVRGDFRFMVVV
jgi:hypothetical protein